MLSAFSLLAIISAANPAALAAAPSRDIVDGGWYDSSYPVPVMHLEGTIEEVARAHGAIVRKHPECRPTLAHFAHAVDDRLDRSATLRAHPVARALATGFYRHFIRNVMLDYLPERYRTAFTLFAQASEIDPEEVWDAAVIPDASLRVVSLLYRADLAPALPASLGCTSIIWNSGPASVLHGRNLDYDGVGYWDRHPVIMHVIPNEGLAYVSVTALGVHAPGITAFNEAGLTLAVHQLTLSDTQASGTPVAVISAEVVRNARSIDDAVAIIRNFPRAGGWAYVLSHGRDRAVVETSASEVAIRRTSEPFFFQTNHVSSPALAGLQIFYSPGSWLDSFTRAARLGKIAASPAIRGWATPEQVAAMLGMGEVASEPSPPRRIAGGTIPKLDNIQSVIMDASHRRLWVATATDKLAPNEHEYLEYHWSDLRSGDAPELTGAEVSLLPAEVLGKQGARLRELLRESMDDGRLAANPGWRRERLAEYSRRVAEQSAATGRPPFGTWSGLYLHAWHELKDGDLSPTSLSRILQALELALLDEDLSPASPKTSELSLEAARHRMALGRLTRGRVLDLLGRRSEALFDYYVVARTARFERLAKAARHGLSTAFSAERARALAIDRGGIDLYQY